LQTFTGAEGGIAPPDVTFNGNLKEKGFEVANNAAFDNPAGAFRRSCDVQHNKCADSKNQSGQSTAPCSQQLQTCLGSVQNSLQAAGLQ
jgi:hypothetical protein